MPWVENKRLEKMEKDIENLHTENAELKKFIENQTLTNKQIFDNDVALKQMIDETKKPKQPTYYG